MSWGWRGDAVSLGKLGTSGLAADNRLWTSNSSALFWLSSTLHFSSVACGILSFPWQQIGVPLKVCGVCLGVRCSISSIPMIFYRRGDPIRICLQIFVPCIDCWICSLSLIFQDRCRSLQLLQTKWSL